MVSSLIDLSPLAERVLLSVVTLSIDDLGYISEAIIDVLNYDNEYVRFPDIVRISENLLAFCNDRGEVERFCGRVEVH